MGQGGVRTFGETKVLPANKDHDEHARDIYRRGNVYIIQLTLFAQVLYGPIAFAVKCVE